jgi:Uma2 family endonuclease
MGYSSTALSQSPKKTATYADLEALPSHLVGEIIDGELIASPRPSSLHARAATRLGSRLDGSFDHGTGGLGGWVILYEPELHIVGQVLVPDLAGWRRERMREIPDVAAFELAPDWVCEVLSPGTAKIDRAHKMRHYPPRGSAIRGWSIPRPRRWRCIAWTVTDGAWCRPTRAM